MARKRGSQTCQAQPIRIWSLPNRHSCVLRGPRDGGYPNSIAVEASQRRQELALKAEALEPALDAAVSAGAVNSIEQMLCHQIAAAHTHAMKMLERSMTDYLPAVEQVRYTNAAARLMDVCQNGALTFRRIHAGADTDRGGQHVQVNDGGQAVVAGTVKRGKKARREKQRVEPGRSQEAGRIAKMKAEPHDKRDGGANATSGDSRMCSRPSISCRPRCCQMLSTGKLRAQLTGPGSWKRPATKKSGRAGGGCIRLSFQEAKTEIPV